MEGHYRIILCINTAKYLDALQTELGNEYLTSIKSQGPTPSMVTQACNTSTHEAGLNYTVKYLNMACNTSMWIY